jgi:hypothetical protein
MDLQEEIADAVLLVRLYSVLVQTSPVRTRSRSLFGNRGEEDISLAGSF